MIFEDPSRRRWRVAVASFTVLALFGLVLFSLSAAALMTTPQLPGLVKSSTASVRTENPIVISDKVSQPRTEAQWKHVSAPIDPNLLQDTTIVSKPLTSLTKPGTSLRTAFLLQQDSNSLQSFNTNAAHLDAVFPDWFFLSRTDCVLDERISPHVTAAMRQAGTAIFARVTDGEGATMYAKQAKQIMQDPVLRSCVAKRLVEQTKSNGGTGILVDIETLDGTSTDGYLRFLLEIKKALQEQQMPLIVAIPSGNQAFEPELISQIADGVLVIMHGEHYASGEPGPIASQAWFEETLTHFRKVVPEHKLIVGLGSYGMDWKLAPTTTAAGLTFGDVMSTAAHANAHPELTPNGKNMAFGYEDEQGRTHAVWFLDAPTLWNQWQLVNKTQALGFAMWRLGSEDPNVWGFLGERKPTTKTLGSIPALNGVYSATRSEAFRLGSQPTKGEVTFTQDSSGMIEKAQYSSLPTGYVLDRVGNAPPEKSVVLAFTDGPDPVWTPKIMDLLTARNVPAVFFIRGNQAEKYPDLMRNIAQRGYMIGNLGYRQQDLKSVNPDQLRNEVNTTQRLIENATRRHTLLFSTLAPNTAEEAAAVSTVDGMGYVLISPNIRLTEKDIADTAGIGSYVLSQLTLPERHIIAMQDGGGDQAATLAALEKMIPEIKAKGYQFVRIDQAMGVNETALTPSYSSNEAVMATASGILNSFRRLVWPTIFWIFLITTTFSLARILFMSIFVIRSAFNKKKIKYPDASRKYVTVLIPAYNEEKTIAKTIESLQASTHRRFEALVIDDGSTDDTAKVVRRFVQDDPRIRLIQKTNGGKATALNLGMRRATYDIVVTIDADTMLMPQAVDELIRPFADPKVDAVCGNVEVGNTHNLLTGFQTLEYITAQNFDRRAFEELNAISVVPGATGAWRKKRVLAIGGYADDTLTEDADLTIRLLASGAKIVYAPEARSLTEAPDNMRDLAKQRFRWSFGTFQCLGKHANLFFKGNVGWIALPNIFIFQIIFPLLAPMGDLIFIIALFKGEFALLFWSYLFFTAIDFIGSVFAFLLEKKPPRLMLFIFIQRFYYRQFLYITILRAIFAMIRGQRYGWNKLQRTGTVAMAGK